MTDDSTSRTLAAAAGLAQEYLAGLPDRPIFPTATVEELRAALGGPLPAGPPTPSASSASWPPPRSRASSAWPAGATSAS